MSLFINPVASTLLDNQLANLSYLLRDSMRVSGEYVGLPKSVPDDRKIDYQFRHFHAVFYMAFLMELSFRLSDTLYAMPHIINTLGLNKLTSLYKPGDFHLPKNIPTAAVRNMTARTVPSAIHGKMLGSLISPKSYEHIADLLEHEIAKGTVPKAEVAQYRLWAHHFRRTLNPEQYLEKYIAKHITPAETATLTQQLKQFDALSGKVSAALQPQSAKDAMAFLKGRYPKSALARAEMAHFEKAFSGGGSWWELAQSILKQGPARAWKDYLSIRKMARDPLMQIARKQPAEGVQALFEALKSHLKNPDVKATTPFLRQVARMRNAGELSQALKGTSFWQMVRNRMSGGVQAARRFSAADEIIAALREDILLPLARKEHGVASKIVGLFEDLSLSKLNLVKLDNAFKKGNFWVKMPINALLQFLGYGLISNLIDNKILQPYQRKIVKERGDSREILMPGYVGAIPGMAVFSLLMRVPFIQRLGYVASFALSGIVGMAAYAATTMGLFYYRLSQPPKKAGFKPQAFSRPTSFPPSYSQFQAKFRSAQPFTPQAASAAPGVTLR